ncbi:hypothetical protein [Streptomyces mirabilis]|uniref:hypothetical protein n=1 Tax=Streptomyces mirabilis TaxID=68239 RepID=UPI0036BCBDF8
MSREVRIGSKRADDVSGKASTRGVDTGAGVRAVTLYTTNPHGNFTLDLGEKKHGVRSHLRFDGVRWATGAPTELEIAGRCTLAEYPENALAVVLDDGHGGSASFTAARGDGTFVVRVNVTELTAGEWTGELRLGDWSLPLPALPKKSAPAKWRRRGLPWYAKPVPGAGNRFALQVARTNLVKAVAGKLKA